MGPRSHERGNADDDMDTNLAYDASMGPRSHERGNRPLDNSLGASAIKCCYAVFEC